MTRGLLSTFRLEIETVSIFSSRLLKGKFGRIVHFGDTSIKIGDLIELNAMKKIGSEPQLKNAT